MPNQKRCENKASVIRVWPGRAPDLVCEAHAEDTRKVADALGMPDPIVGKWPNYAWPGHFVQCTCYEGHVQEVDPRPKG